jgi:plasmid segregation protein ParM
MVKSYGARAVSTDYSTTPSYKALFLGALAYLETHFGATTRIDIKHMVVGLPLSTVGSHQSALKRMVEATHSVSIGDGEHQVEIQIHRATVVAQPMGALLSAGLGMRQRPNGDNTLILDMGGGTFDWFVCTGLNPKQQRCGAAPIGMLSCAAAVCERIKAGLSTNREIMARVDEALRTSQSTVRVTGRDIELAQYLPEVDAVLHGALEAMLKSVGTLDDIDSIMLTGGGASLLSKVAASKLKAYTHIIRIDSDPATSNVRGFHILAEFLNGQVV